MCSETRAVPRRPRGCDERRLSLQSDPAVGRRCILANAADQCRLGADGPDQAIAASGSTRPAFGCARPHRGHRDDANDPCGAARFSRRPSFVCIATEPQAGGSPQHTVRRAPWAKKTDPPLAKPTRCRGIGPRSQVPLPRRTSLLMLPSVCDRTTMPVHLHGQGLPA